RLLRADRGRMRGLAGGRGVELRRAFLEELAGCRVHQGLRAPRADHAGSDEPVEDRADQQAADEANGDVPLRVLSYLGRGRDRVEADISEEDRGGRPEDA